MTEILDVNAAELLDIVSKEPRVAVLVWIRSCSKCSKFKPVFNQLPEHVEGTSYLRMNQLKTIENLRYSEGLGMEETPTTFLYCNGEHIDSIVEYHPLDETVKMINKAYLNRNC